MANSLQVNIPNGPNFSLSANSDLVKLLIPNNLQGVISILQGNLAAFTLTFRKQKSSFRNYEMTKRK